jgi:replicative DNA helicase
MSDPIASIEAEMCALGCCFLSAKGLTLVSSILKPEHYYQPSHTKIMQAILHVRNEGMDADLVTVRDRLLTMGELQNIGGADYLIQVIESVPSVANAVSYSKIVKEKWHTRTVWDMCKDVSKKLKGDNAYEEGVKFVRSLPINASGHGYQDYSMTDIVAEIRDDLNNPKFLRGIPCGFGFVDNLTSTKGLAKGEPTVISAPTGRGKSSMMTNMALNLVRADYSVAIATYEMDRKSLALRFTQHMTGISGYPETETERVDFENALDELSDPVTALQIYDTTATSGDSYTVESLASWLEASCEIAPIDVLMVDYAQLVGTEKKTSGTFEELTHVSRILMKSLKKTGVAGVLLSQENDDGRTSYSRELEKASAQVLSINSEMNVLHVKKSRHGISNVKVPIMFDPKRLSFYEMGSQ